MYICKIFWFPKGQSSPLLRMHPVGCKVSLPVSGCSHGGVGTGRGLAMRWLDLYKSFLFPLPLDEPSIWAPWLSLLPPKLAPGGPYSTHMVVLPSTPTPIQILKTQIRRPLFQSLAS